MAIFAGSIDKKSETAQNHTFDQNKVERDPFADTVSHPETGSEKDAARQHPPQKNICKSVRYEKDARHWKKKSEAQKCKYRRTMLPERGSDPQSEKDRVEKVDGSARFAFKDMAVIHQKISLFFSGELFKEAFELKYFHPAHLCSSSSAPDLKSAIPAISARAASSSGIFPRLTNRGLSASFGGKFRAGA